MVAIYRKPFNWGNAKNGASVVTRDGRSVRIVHIGNPRQQFPIIAIFKNDEGRTEKRRFTIKGRRSLYAITKLDLFIQPKTHEL